ncbi:MAG: DUF485 domain-containing protein [Firmicutes bacterium]|nr:DUF485 domain-containing protein [Bacillota bacterium]
MAVKVKENATINKESTDRILNDPDFIRLSSTRNRIAAVLTALTLIVYYGFILLMAYGKETLSKTLSPNITIGLPIGVAVIVLSWIFVFIYARWANRKYDSMVDQLKEKIGG